MRWCRWTETGGGCLRRSSALAPLRVFAPLIDPRWVGQRPPRVRFSEPKSPKADLPATLIIGSEIHAVVGNETP